MGTTQNTIGFDAQEAGGYSCVIAGGSGNFINGECASSVIGGGAANLVDWWQTGTTIAGGVHNSSIRKANGAVIGGGTSNVVSASSATVPGGAQANARLYGQMAYAGGQFSSPGDAQTSTYVCRGTTTNATLSELFLDGAAAPLVLATNSTWSFDVLITGRASNGDSAAFRFLGAIKNNAGVVSLVGSPVKNALGQDVPSWDATISADISHQALALNVSGSAATSIRWVANVRTTEVIY